MTTNCIKFTSADIETAKGVGSISTLTFDLDISVEPDDGNPEHSGDSVLRGPLAST